MQDKDEDERGAGATCAACGLPTGEPSVAWTAQATERGRQWLCPACTRHHLRAIEGRLDEQWW